MKKVDKLIKLVTKYIIQKGLNDDITFYFVDQVLSPCRDEEAFLHVPPLEKQFLISPPCSPPVGWEQPREDKPVVDYDLLAAMAQLSPGKMQDKIRSKFLCSG